MMKCNVILMASFSKFRIMKRNLKYWLNGAWAKICWGITVEKLNSDF